MMDDVGVKVQKPHKKVARIPDDAKRLNTTVVLIEDSKKSYHYATEGINKEGETIYSIEKAIIDTVCEHHDVGKPIPMVAITDGAMSIRLTLQAVFGLGCLYYLGLVLFGRRSATIKSKKSNEHDSLQ